MKRPHKASKNNADGELPPVEVFRIGQQFEARFVLVLAAIAAPDAKRQTASDTRAQYLQQIPHWPPALEPGHVIELIYQFAAPGVSAFLSCQVKADDAANAITQAEHLRRNLAVVLEPVADWYAFAPAENARAPKRPPTSRTVVVEPVGYRMAPFAKRAIGFSAQATAAAEPIILDCPTGRAPNPFDTVLQLASLCDPPAAVRIAYRGVQFSETQRQAIARAEAQMPNALDVRHADEGRRPVLHRNLLRQLEQRLADLSRGDGYLEIRLTVQTHRPPAATLLMLLGSAVFRGQEVTWRQTSMPKRPLDRAATTDIRPSTVSAGPFQVATANAVDLRRCMPLSKSLWLPLPSLRACSDAGIPRLFPGRVDTLPGQGTRLGQLGRGQSARTVRFAEADRARHCYLLGATGTGKSTLLFNMIQQDIEAGSGLCLLDPHGDLIDQLLQGIPDDRIDDLVLIDPSNPERAAGLNFLETDGNHRARRMNFVTNEMIRIFDRLYDLRQTGGPIFEQYMRNALLLLMDNAIEGATLVDVPWLFEDRKYRRLLLNNCHNDYVKSFWKGQAEKAGGEASLDNVGPYITSKLNQFTQNATLRPIIGQSRSTIDFRACIDEGRIVLVNLSKGGLGSMDAKLLGMLVMGRLFDAALGRWKTPNEQRRPFHVYVDEAQNFVTDTVAELLSEARKFGLYLTLANQNLGQMASGGTDLISSLLGNVGTLLLFRLGLLDADRLADFTRPELGEKDLQDLPNYHVAARLLVDGRPSRGFVFQTDPPLQGAASRFDPNERRERIQQVQTRYAQSVQEVEAEIIARRAKLAEAFQ